jgi:hypothetical protein
MITQQRREALQYLVAHRATAPVIHFLKMIQIGNQQAEGVAIAPTPFDFGRQRFIQLALVADPGQ